MKKKTTRYGINIIVMVRVMTRLSENGVKIRTRGIKRIFIVVTLIRYCRYTFRYLDWKNIRKVAGRIVKKKKTTY